MKHLHSFVAVIASFLVLGVLLTIPYAVGYGAAKESLSQFLLRAWQLEDWQHCWLILPAIALMIYGRRRDVGNIPIEGSAYGLVFLGIALSLFWIGSRVENLYFGYAAIQIFVLGLLLWLGGIKFTAFFSAQWAFLIFVWPLMFLDTILTFPLRMIMSHASVVVLNVLGTPVILQGTGLISAPDLLLGIPAGKKFSVDVADPCSGIRSLFALMMVSALYAHFTLNTWWKKWILFVCSVPLAIAGNLVRILTLTLGTMMFGAEFAIGKNALTEPSWFHMGAGYMVFAVALGGMVGIGWLLNGGATGFAGRIRSLVTQNQRRSRISEKVESGPATPKQKRQDLY